jgi:predicted transcriptional regulator
MFIKIHLRVKFRFMGFTLSTVEQKWELPLNLPNVAGLFSRELLRFDERGILLIAAIG